MSFLSIFFVLGIACKKEQPPQAVAPPVQESKAPKALPKEVISMVQNFQRIFFDFNKSGLSADGKSALDENVIIMQKNPNIRIEIQGHADERGTTSYNSALGQKRAQSVANYFIAQGIANNRIKVISYGEEAPLRSGTSENAWSQNRRCEFAVIWTDNPDVKGTIDKK